MSKTKITSPVEGLNTSTAIGPLVLNFKDSVAEVDSDAITEGAKRYLKNAGYGIGDSKPTARTADTPQPPDPRKVGQVQQGTKTRDAAVDPRDTDFLAPTNAGKANPHGTEVVSPEIHASEGVRPVRAGEVHVDDPDAQDSAETAHAAAATDGTPVTLTAEERELLGVNEDGTPVDSEGNGTPATPPSDSEGELKGQALTDALKDAGLPVTGSADEKRARLAEHQARG